MSSASSASIAVIVHHAAADSWSASCAAGRAPATFRRSRRSRGPCPSPASRRLRDLGIDDVARLLRACRPTHRSGASRRAAAWRRRDSRPPSTSISSRLPPPRSPAMPSAAWKPVMMPCAASSASSRAGQHADRAVPRMRSAWAMNSGPLSASRAAAVAMTSTFLTPSWSIRARKRRSARSARLTASGAELAGRGDRAAEAAQHLLVEQRRRRAAGSS